MESSTALHKTEGTGETLASWVSHPAAGQPRKLAAVVGYLLLATGAVQLGFDRAWLSALTLVVLTAAAAEFLFPITYRLTTTGASRRGLFATREVAWSEVRAVYRFPQGLKLSTQPRPNLLEPYRGFFVPFGDDPETVLALVDRLATARRGAQNDS